MIRAAGAASETKLLDTDSGLISVGKYFPHTLGVCFSSGPYLCELCEGEEEGEEVRIIEIRLNFSTSETHPKMLKSA